MAIQGYCGGKCSECQGCSLDNRIPCSPDCINLTQEGNIRIEECLKENCEEVKYIFNMEKCANEEIIKKFGKIAPYPYI